MSTMVESKKGKAVQSSNYTNQLLTLIKKIHSPKNDNAINRLSLGGAKST